MKNKIFEKILISVGFVLIIIAIVLGFKNSLKKSYNFYDLEGNFGTSSKCELKDAGAYCKTSKGYILVSQYEEVSE